MKNSQEKTIIKHLALHGNVFNPNRMQIVQYPELSKCSKGKLWKEDCLMDTVIKYQQEQKQCARSKKRHTSRKKIDICQIRGSIPAREKQSTTTENHSRRKPHRLPRKTSTKLADITAIKLLINSTLSTPNAKWPHLT
mmetsp:Transcript_12604/g.18115  ORF Transcript_12604/g.18115 Transcript_12604/m.18115 type:complete len:138 (-) Transcript_12604:69-482(-)